MLRAAALAVSIAAPAAADIVYQTQGPFGGFFGLWGPTVSSSQIVGARFVPAADHTLSAIRIWLMNDAGTPGAPVRITLRADGTHSGGTSIPGTQVLAQWDITCQAAGWNPVQHSLESGGGIALRAGARYWVVAQSDEPGGFSPVWNFAAFGNSWSSIGLRSADLDANGAVDADDLGRLLAAWSG
jgi:hypothetical protein